MNIFGISEAKYFCSAFSKMAGAPAGSVAKYIETSLHGLTSIIEGTSVFSEYRDCGLREVERNFFLSLSNYRRALDLMTPGASSWAHVTLYYSSFYSARCLLGMFGGWVDRIVVVDVDKSKPGGQAFAIKAKKKQTTYTGSHEQFWDIFYSSIASLVPWIDPSLRYAIAPVSSTVIWQTQRRNDVNYDTYEAFQLAKKFQLSFNAAKFPSSLPGSLSTQFSISEGLLQIASSFIRDFGLATDALLSLMPIGPRKTKLEKMIIHDRAPSLVDKTEMKSILV